MHNTIFQLNGMQCWEKKFDEKGNVEVGTKAQLLNTMSVKVNKD